MIKAEFTVGRQGMKRLTTTSGRV